MSDKVKCAICGREFSKLMQHVRTVHQLTKEEYLELYPGSPTVSEEYSKFRSDILHRQWEDPVFQEQVKSAASIQVKKLHELQRSDPVRRAQMSVQMKKQADEWWKDPEYRERQSKKSSDVMTRLNEKNWSDPAYREERSKCSSETMTRTLNRLWKDEDYKDKMSIRSQEALRKQGRLSSKLHKCVSDYLTSLGIHHENEKRVQGVLVDIYLDDGRIIEVNGEYWHGKHDVPLSEMTPDQVAGYMRDMKRIEVFGESNILFLWESSYYDGSYVSIIDNSINERG